MAFEGIVNVLKPPGMTSSDVVVDIRKIFNEKRVGHTGTLDPAASGVLPVCIGRATRLFDYLVDKQKEYIAELRFGVSTDTLDAFGMVTDRVDCDISETQLKAVLPEFTGRIEQLPPIYSSISVNGVKLYKLARRGEVTQPIEGRRRSVNIYALELIDCLGKNSFLIRISCSKGTYIRTLCKDIGSALGVPAYMPFLLRTASGSFGLDASFTIAELCELRDKAMLEMAIVPMDRAIAHIPELRLGNLSARRKRLLINGAAIPYDGAMPEREAHRLYIDGEFIGIGIKDNSGLHITVWLGKDGDKNG